MSWQRTRPVNRVVLNGQPQERMGKVGGTVTEMKPGRLISKGTNDDDIIICTASIPPAGWLGYEQTHANYKPDTPDTAYAANDWATIINGPMVLNGYVTETVAMGDALVPAANGQLSKYALAATSDPIVPVAIAEESRTGAGDCAVRSLI